jgi:spore maturation protein CgeB
MQRKFKLAYFAHTLRSDWNNGNAHFLRGLLRSLGQLGHDVTIFEPQDEWSITNLREEALGEASLQAFATTYPDLNIISYTAEQRDNQAFWTTTLRDTEVVILHEWNPPQLAHSLLELRDTLNFRLLFHDTHHRASSSPEQIKLFGIDRFDGVLAFGEALRSIYRDRFNFTRVWTLHEAADTTVFHPLASTGKDTDVVWIGNWGEGERSSEIREFLLSPAAQMRNFRFQIYGVRYPADGLSALAEAGVHYGGYLPNLSAPEVYSRAGLTVHIPRQQYSGAMTGIPTIRVFEALACGIPLISAPWQDTENLFREGDFLWATTSEQMKTSMHHLLTDPKLAAAQAARGLETILARHTCAHRAEQLTSIFEELSR